MFYRYEAKHISNDKWIGIFQAFNPSEKRKWNCLYEPKWYRDNPHVESKAWFTEHGYNKWKNKMNAMIEDFHFGNTNGWEFRIVKKENLDNIVMYGKSQVIQKI